MKWILCHYINRIRELGIKSALGRLCRRLQEIFYRKWLRFAFLIFRRTSSPRWRVWLAIHPWARPRLKEGLEVRFPFWDLNQKENLAALLHREYKDHVKMIKEEADAYASGVYQILGIEALNLKKKSLFLSQRFNAEPTYLPWHFDWVSGYRWDPAVPYTTKDWENLPGVDVKRPLELSRMHHLVTLSQAFLLTQKEEYLKEVIAQIINWHRENPPGLGINWSCAMEASIRLINVLFALALLGSAVWRLGPQSDQLKRIFPGFVLDHILFIFRNLEWPNNHLLTDLAGLSMAVFFYPYFQAGDSWISFAQKKLDEQIEFQVYPDGMDFESSTSYHRFATELFLYPWLIWRNEPHFKLHHFEGKLKKMLKAFEVFQKPSGQMAQFGDNDSGYFLPLAPKRSGLECLHLLSIGAMAFNDPSLLSGFLVKPRPSPESLWLLGPQAFEIWQKFRLQEEAGYSRKVFMLKRGGIYAFQNHELKHFLCISLMPNGQNGNGGHAHNDKLSFELACYGEDLFVDPGTGSYLPDTALRNEFRSTFSHNTLGIDAQEQNRINKGTFSIEEDVKHLDLEECLYEEGSGTFRFLASHDGYLRLPVPLMHKRSLRFHAPFPATLVIEDEIYSERYPQKFPSPVSLCWNFTLAPGLSIASCAQGLVCFNTPLGKKYSLEAPFPWEIKEGKYSPEYGNIVPTVCLVGKSMIEKTKIFTIQLREQG